MIGQRLAIGFLLLVTAVPSGCLPLLTLGAIKEEVAPGDVRTVRGRPVESGRSRQSGLVFIGILLVLGIFLNWRFWRVVARVNALGDATWMELSRGPWLILLLVAYAMGLAGGIIFLLES